MSGVSRQLRVKSRRYDFAEELKLKVAEDLGMYVFLSPKTQIDMAALTQFAHTRLPGYAAYRMVTKKNFIVHVYLKFDSTELAMMAIDVLKVEWKHYLHVASVSALLETMYSIENTQVNYPLWTSAIIDVVGEVSSADPLERTTLNGLLSKFGQPRIYDLHSDGTKVRSVQALFSSMAEALGASIVKGQWTDLRDPDKPLFHYRIRIVGGEKEAAIFAQLRIPHPKTVFDMDYFVGGENPTFVDPKLFLTDAQVQERHGPQQTGYHAEYQNYQQVNQMNLPPQGGAYRPRGRTYRRQFNNRNGRRDQNPPRQQSVEPRVPGS